MGTIGQEDQARGKGRMSGVDVCVTVGVKTGEEVMEAVGARVGLSVGTGKVAVISSARTGGLTVAVEPQAERKNIKIMQKETEDFNIFLKIRKVPLENGARWRDPEGQKRSSRGRQN